MKSVLRWSGIILGTVIIILVLYALVRKVDFFERTIRSHISGLTSRESIPSSDHHSIGYSGLSGVKEVTRGNILSGNQMVDQFDARGNLITRIRRTTDEDGNTLQFIVTSYRYDSLNRKIEEKIDEYLADGSLQGSIIHRFIYNIDDQQTDHLTIWLDSRGNPTGRIRKVIHYNSIGKPEEEVVLNEFDRPVSKIRYVYESGILVKEHLIFYDENGAVREEKLISYEEHALL